MGHLWKNIIFILLIKVMYLHAQTIDMAWMATQKKIYFFNASSSLGALADSVETIQNDSSILNGYTFTVRYKNSDCSSKQAVGNLFDYFDEFGVPDVFLGPICSGAMAPVAQVASYLNRPVLGWISSDPPLADKSIYTTLLRFLWPLNNIGQGLILLLERFNWKRVSLISTTGGDYGELARGVRDVLDQSDFTVSRWVSEIEKEPTLARIESIYDLVKGESRIILLCSPEDELRDWALGAYNKEMHLGEYVFLHINQQTANPEVFNKIVNLNGDDNDAKVTQAFFNFFLMFAKTQAFEVTNSILDRFKTASDSNGWPTKIPAVPPVYPDFYSLFLYDAMKVYGRFATAAGTTNNGSAIFDAARGSYTPDGATGPIFLDDECDRIPDYYIFKVDSSEHFSVIASTVTQLDGNKLKRDLNITGEIIWGDGSTGAENAPADRPECGFDNELCSSLVPYIVPPVIIVVLIIVAIVAFFIYRKVSYERDLANMAWKLDYNEINIYTGQPGAASFRAQSMHLRKSHGSLTDSVLGQMFVTAGNYRGTVVAVKTVHKDKVDIDRALLEEMRAMQEVQHSNLNTFIGASTEAPNIVCVWDYCTKGSLQDVIWNDNIQLDDMFKFSICIDILKGIAYLHESRLRVHGRLRSSNVLIDGRWVCKLTDFGLSVFTKGQREDPEMTDNKRLARMMWTPPEVLRETLTSGSDALPSPLFASVTPQADVYAAAVIIKEVMCRNEPYTEYEDDLTQEQILEKLREPVAAGCLPFRPSLAEIEKGLQDSSVSGRLKEFLAELWHEDPKARPAANAAVKQMTKINPFKKSNVMDNMIAMMEKHAKHLEEIVAERTVELEGEKKKTESLLYRMLPRSVAEDLKAGKTVDAETFDCVTIYFSDIFGFTELAAECSPLEIVDVLNGVYTLFDETIPRHDVYKVETVGDVYVLVSGLPIRNGDRHVVEISNCALDIMSGVMGFKVPHKPKHQLRIRIGIHTGTIVTGVVGLTMPRFCLFGDTINTTSRMESTGAPMRIHLSPMAYAALSKFSGYSLADRGEIDVKGKGRMNTYWLLGREDFNKALPDFNTEFKKDNPTPKILPVTQGKAVNPKVIRPSTESGFSETMAPQETVIDENFLSPTRHVTQGSNREMTPVSVDKT